MQAQASRQAGRHTDTKRGGERGRGRWGGGGCRFDTCIYQRCMGKKEVSKSLYCFIKTVILSGRIK